MRNQGRTFETEPGGLTRRDVLRRLGVGGAALALPGLLAACGGTSTKAGQDGNGGAGTDAEIDSITWSLNGTPPTLDIKTGNVTAGVMAMALGLEALVTVDDDLRVKPLLAESWSQPDPLTYVYKLRSGVTFWDGTPLTAEDAAFSLARHMDPKDPSQIAANFANTKSVEVTGEREITVHMKRPDPLFQYQPLTCFVTPKAYSEKLGKKLGRPGPKVNTMGTGPYVITSFTDTEITVERNPRYWGEKPRVRQASLKFISDPQANLLAMRAGEIDGIFEFPVLQAAAWDRLRGARTQYTAGLRVTYLSFDMDKEPWNDIHVRRAIAHASDRAGFVKAFLGGHGRVANAVAAPESWAQVASPAEVKEIYGRIPDYPFDLEAAKRELAQSAHPDGFTAKLQYPASKPEVGRALVSLSETLKQLRIDLQVREVPANTWLAAIYAHEDLGLQILSLSPEFIDPANFPAGIYPSANAAADNFNTANFKNAAVDKLIEKGFQSSRKAERNAAIAEVLRISGEQLPYLPLWWEDSSMAINDKYVWPTFNPVYYQQNWLSKLRAAA